MEKMKKEEKINLIRSLIAASNAFHDKLKECGYSVSYGASDLFQTGSIRKLDVAPYNSCHLGDLTIVWKIKSN